MKTYRLRFTGLFSLLVSTALFCGAAESPDPAKEDFSPIAAAVVKLLQSGDAEAFAKSMAPSMEDWRAVVNASSRTHEEDPLNADWKKSLEGQRLSLESSAKQVLAKVAELKIDFIKVKLNATVTPPGFIGNTRYGNIHAEGENIGWAEKAEVVLTAEPPPDAPDAERLRGEYKLAISGLLKFPAGWRSRDGVRWTAFPAGVATENVRFETALLDKAAAREGINQADDQALLQLGDCVSRFVQSQDLKMYQVDCLVSLEAIWSMIQKQAASGRPAPTRKELEEHWESQQTALIEPAEKMVKLMTEQGIDLSDARIVVKEVSVNRLFPPPVVGNVEGLNGDGVTVVLSVKSDKQSKTGKELSGEYSIGIPNAMRIDGRWLIGNSIRFDKFPEGVMDEKTLADLEFESYVAKHGMLPTGTIVPDIEFIGVNDEKKGTLKDLRGKIVILDFWATWCGPCQEPMAKMQKYREENPSWKDRVEILTVSIDDELKTVRDHLNKRGWTNTFNTWGGKGGWQSAPPKAFRVRGVPTCYVIDAEGKIVEAGHHINAPQAVNRLLK